MTIYTPIVRPTPARGLGNIELVANSVPQNIGSNEIIPLYESFESSNLTRSLPMLLRFKRVLVDYPLYLDGNSSLEQRLNGSSIVEVARDLREFHQSSKIIPVISQDNLRAFAYQNLIQEFNTKKAQIQELQYSKFAFRIFVGPERLVNQQVVEDFSDLVGNEDILLIDNLEPNGRIECLLQNIKFISRTVKQRNPTATIILLNLFNTESLQSNNVTQHNFGPISTCLNEVSGFGDMMIETRFPTELGPGARSRGYSGNRHVRIFDYTRFSLLDLGFNRTRGETARGVATSDVQANAIVSDHQQNCEFCYGLDMGTLGSGDPALKRFRNGHYLRSILNDIFPAMAQHDDPSDLDMEGADLIRNVISGDNVMGC
jgi:hypothetical protein